jgi:outer membrane protein assembly factor BamB
VVYVGSYDYNLYALDASTGQRLWSAATGGSIAAAPAVANGVVYAGAFNLPPSGPYLQAVYAFGLPPAEAPIRPDPAALKPDLSRLRHP